MVTVAAGERQSHSCLLSLLTCLANSGHAMAVRTCLMSNESFARHKHGHVGGIWTSATSHANLEISQSISQLEGGLTFTPLNSLALSCPCQGWGKATQHQRGHDRTCCWPPPPTGQAIGRQMHSLPHGHIQLGGGKGE